MKKKANKPRVIGLTGNFACGKSTVARMLKQLGFAVVDADEIAREVTAPGQPALTEIKNTFGDVDRARLREIVFNDLAKRKQLEAIMHPAIMKESRKRFAELSKEGHDTIIYEATLIVESGRTPEFDGILLITSPPGAQLARARKRDPKLSAELAQKILDSQMPQDEKRRAAKWVIENDGTEQDLQTKVTQWARNF